VIPGSGYTMMWYGPSILEENPEVGNRFMVAYLKGVRQFNEGKTDRNVEILAKYAELEEDLVRDSCWVTINGDGQINIDSVFNFQEWALGNELLDHIIPAEQFWDSSFIDYALEELGKAK
jgi:NitT/TauT family transport system substrate-binding protein